VALYPESVAGRLAVPEEEWIELFGGPARSHPKSETTSTTEDLARSKSPVSDISPPESTTPATSQLPARPPSPQGSVRGLGLLKSGLESLRQGNIKKEDELETASIKAKKKECKRSNVFSSLQQLMYAEFSWIPQVC
jgi:Vam6/Vps39-like protein vacuolar protein sorting-associated protein 39